MNRRSVNAIAVTIAAVMTIGHPMVATAPQAKNNSEAVSTLIDALRRSRAIGDRGAEDRFWRRVAADGAPLIEPYKGSYLVSFVWHGDSQTHNVVVFSQIGGADPAANKMAHVDGTDVWFRTYVLPRRARLTYRLSPNDSLLPLTAPNLDIVQRLSTTRLDPLNPHHFPPRGDVTNPETVSLVEMPDAPSQQFVTPRPNTPRGNLTDVQFTSEVLGNTRSVHVYTPTGYAADAEPYASLVMFDGESYVKLVSAPTILDNLINDRTIPPTVAVFVDNAAGPAARDRELPCYRPFADAIANELMPRLRRQFNITRDPARTVIAGSSYGGLAAICGAMWHPEVFGGVLSQSASLWWKPAGDQNDWEWVKRQLELMPPLHLRIFITVGTLEVAPKPGGAPTQLDSNRRLCASLRARRYDVMCDEFISAHEYVAWQGELKSALASLLARRSGPPR